MNIYSFSVGMFDNQNLIIIPSPIAVIIQFLSWEECYNYCDPCKDFYPCFLIIIYVWTFLTSTCHDLFCYSPYVASTNISMCPTSAGDDTDNSVVFLVLFALSLVVIIVLVVVIIYLIVKLKKVATYSPQT